jgi:hypothetical protein
MAEFKVNRLRYNWRGNWATATEYLRDDIIKFGAKSWVCIRRHTSTTFAADFAYTVPGETLASPAWVQMTDGFTYRNEWANATLYNLGDIISYGGVLYLCTTSYTSTSVFDDGLSNLTVYVSSVAWTEDWLPSHRYGIGDVVRYNGTVYRCITGHTSGLSTAGLEADQAKWQTYFSGVEYTGDWAQTTKYAVNDLVKYGATIFRCTTAHTSSSTFSGASFTLEFPASQFKGDWIIDTYYAVGDVVRRGGDVFIAQSNNIGQVPSDSIYQPVGTPAWAYLCTAINFRGEFDFETTYRTGDVIRRGGYVYKALIDTANDLSSTDYLDTSNWELLIPSTNYRNDWTISTLDQEGDLTFYAVGDIVTYEGSLWKCNFEHYASVENYPSLDSGSGFFYWDLVLLGSSNNGLRQQGDLLTYNLSRSLAGDGSTFGPTAVPIGDQGKILTIDNSDNLVYVGWGNVQRLFYVAPQGIDDTSDPDRGINYFKPFKTIRFACEFIEAQNYTSGGSTIHVWTGTYEEILPIIIPAATCIQGVETRAVTVKPNKPIAALAGDAAYTIAALQRMSAIMFNIIEGNAVTPTTGNAETQDDSVVSTGATALVVQTLIQNIIDYINFYINSVGSNPTMTGSNNITTNADYISAAEVLTNNREFLAAEAVAYIQYTYPAYEFEPALCLRDAQRYVDAFIYDLQYVGNYKSLMSARYYKNAVLGSLTEDMFYVRDSTGVRNMTLSGLTGTLSPPLVNELYRRPTGGSYVSLDPGWGPNDERVWITNRSCYVQNVATFGYGVTGQKIDGSLHNGGNKSIVSNDFTQVISDGIGAWALNGGRAELVSVFSYYAQIGYFAELGGIIRATNGNNSYGDYGALADGNDPEETPFSGTIDNRTGQAIVTSAFAGEATNEILIFEYENAGQRYSTANYTVVGSGTGASVIQDEIRDNGIHDVFITGTGGGYSLIGNNAQTGGLTTITLATNDTNVESELLGLRIILTSGPGTGQYGYVTGYNDSTKVLQVSRESDNQPGWDHVIPGTPSTELLTTGTSYRFEPRPIFSDPGFEATTITLSEDASWAGIAFGDLNTSAQTLTGTAGTGTVVEDDGLTPISAQWQVVRTGRTYTVTLVDPGAGYEDEQIVTLSGTTLGGISPDNDITITVKSTTSDSTNAIVSFIYTGIAASGRFVAINSTGDISIYSDDGTDWQTSNGLPSESNWRGPAYGNGVFVAVVNGGSTAASSVNGIDWTSRSLPASRNWNAVEFGNNVFLTVAGNLNAGAYSTNGTTWSSTSLPTAGDSTINEWVDVAYGKGTFIALANSNNIVASGTYNSTTDVWSWSANIMDVIADSSQRDWVSIAYGNNRWVAISSTGDVAYSFTGDVWYPATLPTQDGSTIMNWKSISYAQGVFFAICDTGSKIVGGDVTTGPTTYAATSYDGVVWTSRELASAASWTAIGFGNPDITLDDSTNVLNRTGMWIALSSDGALVGNKILTGARALGRIIVEAGRVNQVRIWEPGSGYGGAASLTLVDPNNTSDLVVNNRLGDGVLAQPSWINRGNGYRTSTTSVTVQGDGYSDIIPISKFVTISNMSKLPRPGAQLRLPGNSEIYRVVVVLDDPTPVNDLYSATFQISPTFSISTGPLHGTEVEIRERYSQIRITGHDFLDIGTGNFVETNYPELYSTSAFFSAPENEVYESNGGRVFYTSTDQNGNFRTGELFSVEQSTGTVSISADFFDLQGLTELALGGVRLGGSGTVIREFSTDPLFTADSNNVIPTQRATKAYLANRLNIGGSDLLTASFIAGLVKVGPAEISSTISATIRFPTLVNFDGSSNIFGSILAQNMFFKSFGDDINRV